MKKKYLLNKIVVFIDWGTTNYRAYKVDLKKNKILNKIEINQGILKLNSSLQYIKIISKTLEDFNLNKDQFILMAGMVGSKKGLYEAPYVNVPTTLKKIANKILNKKVLKFNIKIVPGLVYKNENFYDVLRGEETLAIGAINKLNIKKKCYLCCPGSHSKWIVIKKNQFYSFSSYMSGELYSAIIKATILSQSLSISNVKISKSFFKKGLVLMNKGYSLSNLLFKVRTMDLFKQANTTQRNSFLSGLIIGLEINHISKKKDLYKSAVILIASGPLTELYSISLKFFKIKFNLVNSDECFITGMKKIYETKN